MLATKVTSPTGTALPIGTTPHSGGDLAYRLFDVLRDHHELAEQDAELMLRAGAGLRFIKSAGSFAGIERVLFRAAVADLDDSDAWIVETAAYYAADPEVYEPPTTRASMARDSLRRALWFAAILRLADAMSGHARGAAATDVYAAWTDDVLYLEFDGAAVSDAQLDRARGRVAALEALVGRRAILGGSYARRGAA